jgi:putative peptidoglycan lipid II flippase
VKPVSTFGTILSSAGIIAFFSLLSRALGLLRDRFLAGSFGAGEVLDAYYAAFKVPDFLFNLLVLGALTSAFVPVVGSYLAQKKRLEANRITSAVFNLLALLMIVLSATAFILAPQLIDLTAPGFSDVARDLTIRLTRIMLLSPIIFGISSVVSSYLNTTRHFTAYAIAPVLYNLGIILGVIFLVPYFGATGLAYGVLLGALLHLFVQIPALIKSGFRYSITSSLRHPGVKKIVMLAGPRVLSIAALQINVVAVTAIASTLATGTVAAYNLAFNLQSLPLGIVGLSLATVIFPYLAEAVSKNDGKGFIAQLSQTIRQMLFLIIPLSVAFILLRSPIVDLAFGTGAFDVQDSASTALALGIFSISLFAQSIVPVLSRAFYALEDTRTPVLISIFSVGANIAAAIFLGRSHGVLGLALAFSGAAVLDFLLHTIFLRARLGTLDDKAIFFSALRTIFATALGAAVLIGSQLGLEALLGPDSFAKLLLQAVVSLLLGAGVYVLIHALFRSSELREFTSLFRSKFPRNRS